MTLSNQQRDALYVYITNVLSESVQDTRCALAGAILPRAAERELTTISRDPSIVDAVMHEITSVTHKAMDDVVETWNRKACGPIFRLPVEVLAQCFSWLDPAERAKLTGISRYIRSVVLGQPSLWARIALYEETPDALALVFERSGRATLDVVIYAWTKDLTDQIAPHIPRMRTLTLNPAQFTAWIFEQPAPLLEVLKIKDPPSAYASPHTVLPSPAWAPRLRRLQLPSTFVLPTFSLSGAQFDHVTYFSGYMTAKDAADTDARTLFGLFPSLAVLKLFFSTDAIVQNMPNTRVPDSLVDLTLRSQAGGRTIPDFLALCHGHPLKHVLLESRVARWWTPVFDHMHSVASAAGLWHFDRGTLRLDNGAVYTPYFPQQNLNLTDLATNLDSLASIVLEARDLPKQLVEVFRMRALHSITVHAPFWDCDWNDNDNGRLCVPGLQVLRIILGHYYGQDQQEEMKQCFQFTEGMVRRLTLEDGSALLKIPRFVLTNVEREHLGAECWSWIHLHVSSVYLDDELLWQQTNSVA